MRRSMTFVRWVTILKDKLRRQRCHLDNYSTCTVHCNQQVLEFQQKLPFFLLSVTSLNDIFCTFKREKKNCFFSRSNRDFYLSIFSATRSFPTKLLDKLTWAISSKELKMYFLASCDLILVSLSCSLPVCQKVGNIFFIACTCWTTSVRVFQEISFANE